MFRQEGQEDPALRRRVGGTVESVVCGLAEAAGWHERLDGQVLIVRPDADNSRVSTAFREFLCAHTATFGHSCVLHSYQPVDDAARPVQAGSNRSAGVVCASQVLLVTTSGIDSIALTSAECSSCERAGSTGCRPRPSRCS